MFFNVFPIPTILLQFLFLIVASATEGMILHRLLQINRRTSIEYAVSINLFAAVLGWLIFFFVLPLLPKPFEEQLISYIFFDRLLAFQLPSLYTLIILSGFTIFLSAFFIKLAALKFLEFILKEPDDVPQDTITSIQQKTIKNRAWLTGKAEEPISPPAPSQAIAILVANACSYSALLLLLVLRFIQFHIHQF